MRNDTKKNFLSALPAEMLLLILSNLSNQELQMLRTTSGQYDALIKVHLLDTVYSRLHRLYYHQLNQTAGLKSLQKALIKDTQIELTNIHRASPLAIISLFLGVLFIALRLLSAGYRYNAVGYIEPHKIIGTLVVVIYLYVRGIKLSITRGNNMQPNRVIDNQARNQLKQFYRHAKIYFSNHEDQSEVLKLINNPGTKFCDLKAALLTDLKQIETINNDIGQYLESIRLRASSTINPADFQAPNAIIAIIKQWSNDHKQFAIKLWEDEDNDASASGLKLKCM